MVSAPPATVDPGDRDRENSDRLTLRLTSEARQTLQEIARLRGGVTLAEVVRRALGTELFMIKAEKEGSRILLESPDKTVRQIILR